MQGGRHYIQGGGPWPGSRTLPLVFCAALALGCGAGRTGSSHVHGPGPSGGGGEPFKIVSPYAAVSFLEAEMAMNGGDPAAAIKLLHMALTSEPDDPLIRARLAAAYLALGKASEAEDIVRDVLAHHPDHDASLVLMGDIAMQKGSIEEAESWYVKAVATHPDTYDAYERLIGLYRQIGDLASALLVVGQLLEADPLSHDAFLTASELALELGMTDDAYGFMAEHIRLLPVDQATEDRYGSLLDLAARLVQTGDTDHALFLYGTFLDVFPDDGAALSGMARALVAAGDTLGAREVLSRIGDPTPDASASDVTDLGWLWLEAGDARRSLSLLQARFGEPVATVPPPARLLWVHALCALLMFDEARAALSTFSEDERRFMIEARGQVAASLIQAGLETQGWEIVRSHSADIPDLLGSRDVREALVAILLAPGDPGVRDEVRLACSTSVQGRLVLLTAQLMASLAPDGSGSLCADLEALVEEAGADDVQVDAMFLMGTSLVEGVCKANPNRILSLTSRMEKLDPSDTRMQALRGMFFLATGNSDRALISLHEANLRMPASSLVALWLARVLAVRGEQARARAVLLAGLGFSPPPFVLGRILAALAPPP